MPRPYSVPSTEKADVITYVRAFSAGPEEWLTAADLQKNKQSTGAAVE